MMKYKIITLLLLSTLTCWSQTKIKTNNIKTIIVKSNTSKYNSAVHYLNNTINFSFDDVSGNQEQYSYKIVHCNIDWTPSNFPETYYLDGFNSDFIENFENSFGTLANYTHYSFNIPNNQTKITKSGNYLFQILNNDNNLIAERKIIIVNPKINIQLKTSTSRDLASFNQKQALSLKIHLLNLTVNFPAQELKPFIYQNGDLNLSTPFLSPTFTDQKTITYRPTKETEFLGGNEFLYFDNHEILVNSKSVQQSYREDNVFHSILMPTQPRAERNYIYNPDINGQFLIRNETNTNTETESEYSWVHFTLKNNFKTDKELYVYGAFNNFEFNKENKLKLNKNNNYYTTKIYLKQGFYNYDFVSLNENINKEIVSGSFFETENNYSAIVYHQHLYDMFYEVIGFANANSKQQTEN